MRKFLDIITGSAEKFDQPRAKQSLLSRYVGLVQEGYSSSTVGGLKLDEFVRGYIEAMLAYQNTHGVQTEEGAHDMGTYEPLKKNFTADDLSHDAMDQIDAECRTFIHKVGPMITPDSYAGPELTSLEAQAGHDFFVARSGAGAFQNWDCAGMMVDVAAALGPVDAYVGPDAKIHLM